MNKMDLYDKYMTGMFRCQKVHGPAGCGPV